MTPERWKGIKEIIKVYGFGLLAVIAISVAWDYL